MNRTILLLSASLVLGTSVGCGDSGGTGGGGAGATSSSTQASSSASTGTTQPGCAVPSDQGNEIGVGKYCTKNGGECTSTPMSTICLADLGQDENFCTHIGCQSGADCGADAGCHIDPMGSACVPCKCNDPGAVGCVSATSSSSSSASSGSASSSAAGG